MYPQSIQKLIEKFSKFPTVGPRTAARFVFYLLQTPEKEIEKLADQISMLKKNIKLCSFCFNPFQEEGNLCPICSNTSRDRSLLCIVEKESDLEALEKIKKYAGLYFILGGTLPALRKEDVEKIRFKELQNRIKNPDAFNLFGANFKEIILATNPTPEGEATALYLERHLKEYNTKITKLARGLPIGGELEYADEETLSSSLESRK